MTKYCKNRTVSWFVACRFLLSKESNGSGFYIGGSEGRDNIVVYMDNCEIYGATQPIVFRGTSNEKNNTLYISNSTINLDYANYGIRIDNDTHKLFIGTGCNFTASNTNRAAVVTQTGDVYRQE